MHDETKLLQILTETCPGVDFTKETALVDDGFLESLDLVTIVSEIMATFDIELNVDDLLPGKFQFGAGHAPFDPEPKIIPCLLRLQNLSAFSC